MSVSLHTTVYNWLRELKIPVSKSYLKELLLSHPDYPSLLSITDTLDELGIENTVLQIEIEQFSELPKGQKYLSGHLMQEMLRTWIIKSKSL